MVPSERSVAPESRLASPLPETREAASRTESVKIVSLDAPFAIRNNAPVRHSPAATWLIAPTMLAATATGILLVMRGPDRLFGLALGVLFALALLWILISVFFPARVERTCPSCGKEHLQRLDRNTMRGVICSGCGHIDSERSSFLMAEEEGPLEPMVIAERERARASTGRGGAP